MFERLILLKELLREGGSIYLADSNPQSFLETLAFPLETAVRSWPLTFPASQMPLATSVSLVACLFPKP
jgi:hypothetical protein